MKKLKLEFDLRGKAEFPKRGEVWLDEDGDIVLVLPDENVVILDTGDTYPIGETILKTKLADGIECIINK